LDDIKFKENNDEMIKIFITFILYFFYHLNDKDYSNLQEFLLKNSSILEIINQIKEMNKNEEILRTSLLLENLLKNINISIKEEEINEVFKYVKDKFKIELKDTFQEIISDINLLKNDDNLLIENFYNLDQILDYTKKNRVMKNCNFEIKISGKRYC
jgi:galactose-1-phosphate uridylyltransferase